MLVRKLCSVSGDNASVFSRVTVPLILLAMQGLWGADDLINETKRIHYQKEMLARVPTAVQPAPGG